MTLTLAFRDNLIGRLIRHHELGRIDMMKPDSIQKHRKCITPVFVFEPGGFDYLVMPLRHWEVAVKLHEPSSFGVHGVRPAIGPTNVLLERFELQDRSDHNLDFLVAQANQSLRLGHDFNDNYLGHGNRNGYSHYHVLHAQAIHWLTVQAADDD
jgi:hypothetical protein